ESDDASSFDPPPPTDEWRTKDSIVKSWIILTLAPTLQGKLRVIQIGDLIADAYFHKIEPIVTLSNDLVSSMTDDDVVTYAINGLSENYAKLATIILHKDPFPDLDMMRSMVITKEMQLNLRSQPLSINTSSSAP
nr:hybrid signal transduction histidine kinase M [Tanacetum cinerariifolium]